MDLRKEQIDKWLRHLTRDFKILITFLSRNMESMPMIYQGQEELEVLELDVSSFFRLNFSEEST